jgi:ElaB protein
MNAQLDALKSDLKQDVRNVVNDTEQLLKAAARSGDDGLAELRTRLELQLRHLRAELGDLEASALQRARAAAHSADQTVRAHPYGAIGLAAAAGLLVGFLAARR